MPKLLVARFSEDSISQFRAAARVRNDDAWRLASAGRGAAAIYLWGHVAEMLLKAAWFSLIGYRPDRAIRLVDLRKAIEAARNECGFTWAGNFHNISHWARLLVQHRIGLGRGYSAPVFGLEVQHHSQRVYDRWREVLRYKKNRAYAFEVNAVARSTEWFLSNSSQL